MVLKKILQQCNKTLVLSFFTERLAMSSQKTFGTSYDPESRYNTNKLIYPAANRNKEPILEVIKKNVKKYFPSQEPLQLLEVSSGSGQHAAHFAPSFPHITFQPSEYEADLLGSISIYANECPTKNIKEPLLIDITRDLKEYRYEENSIDIIYNANMMHISPFECSIGLFSNAGKYLKPGGLMITYGAYGINGVISPDSNVNFNRSLKSQDSRWGIRDISELTDLASKNQLCLKDITDMPANNKCLIWEKLTKG